MLPKCELKQTFHSTVQRTALVTAHSTRKESGINSKQSWEIVYQDKQKEQMSKAEKEVVLDRKSWSARW